MNDKAKQIRETVKSNLPDMSSSPVADKAKQHVLNIDNSDFWTDVAATFADNPIVLLRDLVGTGLAVKGWDYSLRAKMDQKTGEITTTEQGYDK